MPKLDPNRQWEVDVEARRAKTWEKKHTDALTLDGALLVADSCVVDGTDLYRIALKTLAHEYRKLRREVRRS
jgi:hypothetical protein